MKIVLDIETTRTAITGKRASPSCYLPTNRLVTVQYHIIDTNNTNTLVFNHKEWEHETGYLEHTALQMLLNKATLLILHNGKFDLSWLFECGFKYDGAIYDTMIAEYVFAKGLKKPLSLKDSCERYGLDAKSDILESYWEKGINTNEVPLKELIEYGEQDLLITKQLYDKQQERILNEPDCAYMNKSIRLMNASLPSLIDMERAGMYIDLEELDRVEKQYKKEYAEIETRLKHIVVDVMGHTPINLESPEHLAWVLYSRKVKDKKIWTEIFNLGTELRNSVSKTKYSRRMLTGEFRTRVRENTNVIKKTEASQCLVCLGKGKVTKEKKDGTPFKKPSICHNCEGTGFLYKQLKAYAGFKLDPLGSEYASMGGFSTDKLTILKLLEDPDLKPNCREFLTGLLRINAISTYLGTFVEGIKNNVQGNILHLNVNTCITATGRLSSSNPNLQNLPRAKTFPIRKVIISRWKDGSILSVDFEKFEFTIAAILSGDEIAKKEIIDGVDIHVFTRDTLNAAGMNIDRQDAKSRTFGPLYGKIRGTEAEEAYFKAFKEKYKGITEWHHRLEQEALNTKQIKSPSGRIYAFPFAKRLSSGIVNPHTQIKNYLVQGFATADITPVAMIEVCKLMKTHNVQSKLILTVHDDLTFDIHPEEVQIMTDIIKTVFNAMNDYVFDYFGVKTEVPIRGELSIGKNWMEKDKIAS